MSDSEKFNDYDTEPVSYCAKCYSLRIRYEETIDSDYCMDCGCSDILTTDIYEWEELYERRYGHKYTERNGDPTRNAVYNLTIKELKDKVYHSTSWRHIIFSLYPGFSRRLSKTESIILLFDKIIKDNKLNELREILINIIKQKKHGREEIK